MPPSKVQTCTHDSAHYMAGLLAKNAHFSEIRSRRLVKNNNSRIDDSALLSGMRFVRGNPIGQRHDGVPGKISSFELASDLSYPPDRRAE